ncbi:MAG: hypothetical protein ABIJ23_05115 [Candidatus Magasanikbacteria bacterium]
MKTPSLKKKLVSIVLIILGVLFAISFFIIFPSVQKISKLKTGIDQLQNELEQKYINSQKLRRTMREMDDVKIQSKIFTQAVIKDKQELEIITTLEDLAQKNSIDQTLNVSLVGDNTKNDKKNNPTDLSKYYELSFLNNGFFENHINYLHDLERLPYYIIIKNIKFEKRQGISNVDDKKTPVTLSFTGIIYVESQ